MSHTRLLAANSSADADRNVLAGCTRRSRCRSRCREPFAVEEPVHFLRPMSALAALTLGMVACGTTDPGGVAGDPTNATHTLLTDDPFPYDRIARVDLFIVSVSASLTADTSGAGNFVTLATPNRRINLLALQNGVTDELGTAMLPSGAITAVRMVIDTDSSSITLKNGLTLTGKSTPGIQWQSSAGRPVLNA